jgi:hypothetical protein
MLPEIHLNYPAIAAAMAANILIGFLWYGPLFGKIWMKEVGMPADCKPDPKVIRRAMMLMVIGSFLTVFVLAHSLEVWRPSSWKLGPDAPNATYGFYSAFFTWIGFYVPQLFSGVAWENKSWKLFGLNAGYYLVMLLAAGMILAYWR